MDHPPAGGEVAPLQGCASPSSTRAKLQMPAESTRWQHLLHNGQQQDKGAGGTPSLRLSAWGPWQCHCEAGTQARWRRVLRAQGTRPARPPQLVQEAACNLQQCARCTARDCRLLPHKRAVGF
ncbi:unnamed protein product [Lampetra planeri]